MAFGFKPLKTVSQDECIAPTEYSLGTSAAAIYYGDPVKQLTDGSIVVAAAGDLIIGIFAGCSYTDAKGMYQVVPNYDAPTGEADIKALVFDNPNIVFEVLANADVTDANIGALYDFAYAAGSLVNGQSGVTLDIASLATIDKAFRMTGLSKRVGDNARIVTGFFVEHALRGVTAGVGGI
jgi:hypothetical protein